MKRGQLFSLAVALLAAASLLGIAPVALEAKPAKKVLVVTVTKGFRHSSIPTAEEVIGNLARTDGSFTVDYVRTEEELSALAIENLRRYDAVIFANTTGNLPLPDVDGFLNWIRSGKAFVGMHSASDTFRGHTPLHPYIRMLGGEFKSHPPGLQQVQCIIEDPKHPACRHLGPFWDLKDEIYILNGFNRDEVRGLLSLDKHPGDMTPGDYPVSWCKLYGKGRVFYTSLGHSEAMWEDSDYQQHILGGIRWALGLERGDARPFDLSYRLDREEARAGFRPLFNGTDLTGWKLRNPAGNPSWSAQNGMLVNASGKDAPGSDLVTEEKFWNFTARYEYMIPRNSNSGFYLRGRHEVQIVDDYKKGQPSPGGNGAIYNLAPVSTFVSKPPGQWQTAEVTMIGNKVTVILNGVTVHDNVEVNRPTGAEIDGNVNEPGPIMLQGDHGSIAFRNMRIKVLK
jgi:uncharacterized protein